MIASMTGFGSAERITDQYSLKVEIKTLNSKFFDPSFKLPKEFAPWEMDIKTTLEKGLVRGKVNLLIDFSAKSYTDSPVNVNEELFEVYYNQLKALADKHGNSNEEIFKMAVGMPNVIVPVEDISSLIHTQNIQGGSTRGR